MTSTKYTLQTKTAPAQMTSIRQKRVPHRIMVVKWNKSDQCQCYHFCCVLVFVLITKKTQILHVINEYAYS